MNKVVIHTSTHSSHREKEKSKNRIDQEGPYSKKTKRAFKWDYDDEKNIKKRLIAEGTVNDWLELLKWNRTRGKKAIIRITLEDQLHWGYKGYWGVMKEYYRRPGKGVDMKLWWSAYLQQWDSKGIRQSEVPSVSAAQIATWIREVVHENAQHLLRHPDKANALNWNWEDWRHCVDVMVSRKNLDGLQVLMEEAKKQTKDMFWVEKAAVSKDESNWDLAVDKIVQQLKACPRDSVAQVWDRLVKVLEHEMQDSWTEGWDYALKECQTPWVMMLGEAFERIRQEQDLKINQKIKMALRCTSIEEAAERVIEFALVNDRWEALEKWEKAFAGQRVKNNTRSESTEADGWRNREERHRQRWAWSGREGEIKRVPSLQGLTRWIGALKDNPQRMEQVVSEKWLHWSKPVLEWENIHRRYPEVVLAWWRVYGVRPEYREEWIHPEIAQHIEKALQEGEGSGLWSSVASMVQARRDYEWWGNLLGDQIASNPQEGARPSIKRL